MDPLIYKCCLGWSARVYGAQGAGGRQPVPQLSQLLWPEAGAPLQTGQVRGAALVCALTPGYLSDLIYILQLQLSEIKLGHSL